MNKPKVIAITILAIAGIMWSYLIWPSSFHNPHIRIPSTLPSLPHDTLSGLFSALKYLGWVIVIVVLIVAIVALVALLLAWTKRRREYPKASSAAQSKSKKGDKRWIATGTRKVAELISYAVALAALTMGVSYTLIAKGLAPSYADMEKTAQVVRAGLKETADGFKSTSARQGARTAPRSPREETKLEEDTSDPCPVFREVILQDMDGDSLQLDLQGVCLKITVDERVYQLGSESDGLEIRLPTYSSFWTLHQSSPVMLSKDRSPVWLRGTGQATIYLGKE